MDAGLAGAAGSAIVATPSPVEAALLDILESIRPNTAGAVASYIPELTRVDPDLFGICLVTADGHVYAVGDWAAPFTIQSISKPFVYALALQDHGKEEVLRRVGVEPTHEAFNAIVFDQRGNRPFNPMVNAGAIATSAMIRGDGFAHRLGRLIALFEALAGRPLTIDESVFASERETGHRNRAIAYLELNFGMIDERVDEHLDLYFKQCSILVTTRDLAVMAATLANGGVNPLTGRRAMDALHVRSLLSVMTSCGMYDYSGSWTFHVGLPAKSGVGGGIIAVLPGQFGLGVFSPRLDPFGNSVRGVRVCEEIAQRFGLHSFDVKPSAGNVLRRRYGGDRVFSKRRRGPAERAVLRREGSAVRVYELQGVLDFARTEQVLHALEAELDSLSLLILDGKRVPTIDAGARSLLLAARDRLAAANKRLVCAQLPADVAATLLAADPAGWTQPSFFSETDAALEWCEDWLLARHGGASADADRGLPLSEIDLVAGFDAAELAALAAVTGMHRYAPGEVICREGSPADAIYMLSAGSADIALRVSGEGRTRRLGTIGPGLTFGELALLEGGVRSADVTARQPVECYVLPIDGVNDLTRTCPSAAIKLYRNLAQSLATRLQLANGEIRTLEE